MIRSLFSCFAKPLTFKILSAATGALCTYLFVVLLFFPASFLADVEVAASASADFLARRAAMMMLGLAVLSLRGLTAPPSPARQAIVLAVCVTMGGWAALGSWEVGRGFAGHGLLFPIGVETTLCLAYGLLWLAGRQPAATAS
jgi:hypothetical protein